ncbi:hypothetical protein AMATHDRAFT_163453 [Amanita thiersii Skay4041]|uniref:Retrotransposon gag domain-containing protein n=1 Tax=Amanita thiersii Skay4041 TaxID=703135 RepID=A0A2A9N9Z4_9AGAR|nr:hypothetical protein AMATHDRAFT_163453 [Amanita thiersii Skay4041]
MNSNEYQTEFIQVALGVDATEILYWNIYQAFGDLNKQATAILELTTMKQGTKLVEEHVQLFKQAYSRSGYTGIHELKRSLNTPLLDKCMMVPELPNTLDKWYEQNQPQHTTQTTTRPPAPLARYTGQNQDPNTMDVDRNQNTEKMLQLWTTQSLHQELYPTTLPTNEIGRDVECRLRGRQSRVEENDRREHCRSSSRGG